MSFLQGCEFACLNNASLREASFEGHIAGEAYTLGVGCKGAGDDGEETAMVEQVVLEDDVGVMETLSLSLIEGFRLFLRTDNSTSLKSLKFVTKAL